MFDLSTFRLQDMALCSMTVRQLGEGASSIEAAADRITRFLYTNLTTGPNEDPACVLVRAFKTHPYSRLTPELQALVDTRLGRTPAHLDMKCLTLLASTGAVSGWNTPALSSRFRVIPLAGPEALEQLPMFAQLFTQFHIDLPYLQDTPVSLLLDKHATTFNAFHVPQALNSPYVPGQQDFVVPFGVQSVFGCGGLLPTGEMFVFVLFSKIAVSKETADLFKAVALSAKLALAPFEHPVLILPTATAASGARGAQPPATLTALQDRVATLEAILTVQEQAVDAQSSRLENNLAEAVRQRETLQKHSVRVETLSAASPVGLFEMDADGSCLYANAAWQTIAGLSLSETLGAGWRRAIYEEDRAGVLAAWNQTAKADDDCALEFRMQRPDGTIRWVQARSRPCRDDEGRVTSHIGTLEDITERALATTALRESQQRLDLAVQGSQTGIWDWEIRTNQVYFSPIWKRQLGYDAHELQGRFEEWRDHLHPDDRTRALATVESYLAGQASGFELECRLRHKDGSYRWMLARGICVRDEQGTPYRMVGSQIDITEHKDALARPSETDRRRTFAFESSGDGIWDWDAATDTVFFSDRWKTMLGYSPSDIGDTLDEWLSRVHPDDLPPLKADLHRHFRGEMPLYTHEHRVRCKDGSYKWLLNRSHAVARDAEGTPLRVVGTHSDVATRRLSTDALQESDEQFSQSFHEAAIGMALVSTDGRWLQVNRALCDLVGYSREELEATTFQALTYPDDLETDLGYVQQMLNGDIRTYQMEKRYLHKSGHIVWVLLSVSLVRHADGTPRYFIAQIQDRSHRKRAEEQLRLVVEAIPTGILLINHHGAIQLINAQMEEMFGYSRNELIGQPMEVLIPERFRSPHPEHQRRYFSNPATRRMGAGRDLYGLRKDGSEFPVEIGLNPVQTSQGIDVMASVADISLRKQMESTRFQLQQAIDHAQDGIALFDDAGHFTYMNPAHAAIYGYAVGDLLGKNWTHLYPEEWAAMIGQMYLPILRSEGQWQGEVVGKKKSGDAFHVDLSLTLLEKPGTAQQTILCTCRDISLRKQMELDLVAAKDAAEAGIRAKSEFLATMSHEIRTPMNGVLGMTDLLIDTTLTTEQREFVHTLRHSGESLMRIINDILDFSKIEAGKLTIETLPFDLRMTIEDTLDLLAPTAQAKHLELVGLIDAQAPNGVIGDPGRIRQILTNLIGNAIKFTDRGEVLVQVLKAEEEASSVLLRFEIVDTGVGLTEEAKAKLFQSFTQADSSTARKYGGTGLGLAICKRLTELMGGQIGIQSYPGTGTCVWFTIRLRTQTNAPALPAPALVESLSGLRICLIDDNATNRSLLQYHACDWKMHYESAEDGPSALALIRRAAAAGTPFDLAILDMHMPGMDGLELGRTIRADANLNGTRLVLLTSLGRRGDAKLAQSAGFSGYLTKPVRKAHLYDCLRLVMGQAPVSYQESQAAPAETPLITRHQVKEVTAHIRLLVVDDNLVNQKVAVKMLEKLGYRVDVASNGNEALAALTRHHYNLVFMDCQMPELDGFETTNMIRTHEQPGTRLPIIAMTANAMEGDREHCLASGMDDFVSKPVKSQDLKTVLTHWLSPPDDRAAA
ncbi:PAS domain S-box protein [Nitrospira lenta]|uniref:Sensory/regulatory protein RpfC n=1 Tax=Nitrospira lenta TaxID=1436998 RepID=A0A330L4E5_9BACT|nr:PAS domain S-box protein [Nitrospira lenta]SPP63782.1 putative Histidine kinase [Nitrospira lenta]